MMSNAMNDIEHAEATIVVSKSHIQSIISELADYFFLSADEKITEQLDADHPLCRLAEIFDVE